MKKRIKKVLISIARYLLPLLLITALALSFMPAIPALATHHPSQLYEGYSVNDDAEFEMYSNIWGAQSFTVGTTAHTIESVRLLLYREGAPGTVTVSIQETAAGDPDGVDLTIGTLDGDSFTDDAAGVWYEFDVSLDASSVEASTQYAVIVRCEGTNAANTIHWRSDASAGAEANGQEETSANSGATWTGDADDDFMFEIWGIPVIYLEGAQVFRDYQEDGDWLIVLTYENYYPPYYPSQSCPANFYIRLIDGAAMIAQTSCPAWRFRPASLYFSKVIADTMEWGVADYHVRLYGDFGANPSTDYTILPADWRSDDLELLDDWVITQANIIGDEIGIDLVTEIADKGEVLNAAGRVMFLVGIPNLDQIRPNLFEYVLYQTEFEENDYGDTLQATTNWETQVGVTFAAQLTAAGNLFGITGREVGMFIFAAFTLLAVAILAMRGHFPIGALLGFIIMLGAAWLGFIDYIIIGVVVLVFGIGLFIYTRWLR